MHYFSRNAVFSCDFYVIIMWGYDDENKYAYPFAEMGWKYGTYISVKMYTINEWLRRHFTPFYHNIQNDGILIA